MTTYWTIENAGMEKSLADWGIDDVRATYTSQAEETVELFAQGRAFDASELFGYKTEVIIRRNRSLSSGSFSNGTQYFRGLVVRSTLSAARHSESQGCEIVGPWWYLNERGFEQAHVEWTGWKDTPGGEFNTTTVYKSRVFLNQAFTLGAVSKLTTGEQLVEILAWTLKPFTDAGTPPPFQFSAIELKASLAVDPPIDEVKNITCAEAARKMFRWSPDVVQWFDHSTNPPTFHAKRRAGLTAFNLNLTTTRPTDFSARPRYDLQRPFVRIQYEITSSQDGFEVPQTLECIYPNPPPAGALNQYASVPFVIDLRGPSVSRQHAELNCAPIEASTAGWWLDHEPEHKAALKEGRLESVDIDFDSVIFKDQNGVEKAAPPLPNELLGGPPPDWVSAEFKFLTASCQAKLTKANGEKQHDVTFSFQLLATDAVSGNYHSEATVQLGDPIPVGLERDFYEAISPLQWEGSLHFHEAEVGELPALGHKLNLTGSGCVELASMNALVQRVTEEIARGRTLIEFGPPPHLDIADLVSLLRVSRNRQITTNYSMRLVGRYGRNDGGGFRALTAIKNSSHAPGNHQTLVASGSPRPTNETDPAKRGEFIADGYRKQVVLRGAPGIDGTILLQLGALNDYPGKNKTVELREFQFKDSGTCKKYRICLPCTEPEEVS